MDKIPQIDEIMVEDMLALENLFRNAGLEMHSRAIRLALEQAKTDIIDEQRYGTENIKSSFDSINNIRKSIEYISEDITNKEIVDILDNHIDDINNIKNIEYAPKFVLANNISALKTLTSLIEHIKTQGPANNIDGITLSLLRNI